MGFLHKLYNLLRHLGEDASWREMINYIGVYKLYAVLFLIVFCETGLVVTPFLPGDSLLFAIGAVGARDTGMKFQIIAPLLVAAALIGDNLNYWLGRTIGPKIFRGDDEDWDDVSSAGRTIEYATPTRRRSLRSRLLNRKHLERSHAFYEKYGPKTVILARFVPIVRTFSPFVAGIAAMNYATFLLFSVVGAVAWVGICMGAGHFFGGFEFVKKHFELVIVAIVIISVLPMAIEFLKARRYAKQAAAGATAATANAPASAAAAAQPTDAVRS
jgi:membrane-associated protein